MTPRTIPIREKLAEMLRAAMHDLSTPEDIADDVLVVLRAEPVSEAAVEAAWSVPMLVGDNQERFADIHAMLRAAWLAMLATDASTGEGEAR